MTDDRAGAPAVTLPPRPEPPRPEDCCGSGCVRCIYTVYDDALMVWEREVERLVSKVPGSPRARG
ncbi:MAG: oxidoreductase-like domain-containing protein [Betaproteobacteria bacterium]